MTNEVNGITLFPATEDCTFNNYKERLIEQDVNDLDFFTACRDIRMLCAMVGGRNTFAGWRNDPKTGEPIIRTDEMLMSLVVTELGEAFEGVRRNRMDDKLPHRKQVEVELADVLYRLFDWADEKGYDIGGAFAEKMQYNMKRADHKKEERLKEGGKSF